MTAIGAEVRAYLEREHDGAPARVVVAERTYPTTVDDLWDAVTNPARLPRWFLPVEGELKLGGRYQLIGNAGGIITRCDPPDALDLTWEFGGAMSWVTVRLSPDGDGARLTLEHIFLASDADEHWAKYGPAAVGVGWDLAFMGLGLHLADPAAASPPEASAEWQSSEAAKTIMRDSAAAWAAAHIAGGGDPAVAKAMAQRTAEFYTGG